MPTVPLPPDHRDFALLSKIAHTIVRQAGGPAELAVKLPALFRQAIDEVIDTPRTNRFTLSETEKTEKTYLGTKIEILLRNYLRLPKGRILDLQVDGVEVDIKNTMGNNWTIPMESLGHPALLLRSNEKTALCDVGLVQVRADYLNAGENRDRKKTLSATGLANVWWLLSRSPYPPNFWEILPKQDRIRILSAGSASARLAALFSLLPERPISRLQVQGLAQQLDYMKRIRRNGGARDILAPQGVAILWGQNDRALIELLGLGPVLSDEFISYVPKTDGEAELLRAYGHID